MGRPHTAGLALALAALLGGCGGDGGTAEPAPSRATFDVSDEEMFSRCPPLTAQRLARAGVAFAGTLVAIDGEATTWLFEVDRWYTGGDEDEVEVGASDVRMSYFDNTVSGEPTGIGGVEGERYLVAGPGLTRPREFSTSPTGTASACLTRRWTKPLARTFAGAFPRAQPRPFATDPPRRPD